MQRAFRFLLFIGPFALALPSVPLFAQSARNCIKIEVDSSTGNNLYSNHCAGPISFRLCSLKVVDGDPQFVCAEGTALPGETFGSLSTEAVINLSACEPPMRPKPITDTSYICE